MWPYIKDGVALTLAEANGEADAEDTKRSLLDGRAKLVIMDEDGGTIGCIYVFLHMPKYKIARVLLLFGGPMSRMRSVMDEVEAEWKKQGCRYSEGCVPTESRARLFSRFGYKPVYQVVRKKL